MQVTDRLRELRISKYYLQCIAINEQFSVIISLGLYRCN